MVTHNAAMNGRDNDRVSFDESHYDTVACNATLNACAHSPVGDASSERDMVTYNAAISGRDKYAVGLDAPDAEIVTCNATSTCNEEISTKSDPREVLATVLWSQSVDEWSLLQSRMWAGHPPLWHGWIRGWARRSDQECYWRLKDMYTTFELGNVIDR